MSWSYSFARRAERDLGEVGDSDRRRILETLDRLAADPSARSADVTKLSGADNRWRLRVGAGELSSSTTGKLV
jgi:mRNA-degrading endonuclease RelE of RelBE toxin-antitoxin system